MIRSPDLFSRHLIQLRRMTLPQLRQFTFRSIQMAHLGTLRDFRFEEQADDVRGAVLYGRDNQKLGKIHDVIFDHGDGGIRYVVVDAGGWLKSKLFLVPADRISPRNDKEDEYVTALSEEQIKNFPPYDENNLNDEKHWGDYERDYHGVAKFEETGGVLHQAGGTNILVPEGLPAEGSAPQMGRKPISGYKSPIRHRDAGPMNTSATAWGNTPDDERLTFVPDAVGAGRGDIEDKEVGTAPVQEQSKLGGTGTTTSATAGSIPGGAPDRSVGEAAD